MIKKWLTGWELVQKWEIEPVDLADMVLNKELLAYEPDTLAALDVQKETEYLSYLSKVPYAPERALIPTLIERIVELRFKVLDMEKFEKLHGMVADNLTAAQSTQATNKEQEINDYIKSRKAAGVKDEVIAVELHDNMRLTYAEMGRHLGLDHDLNRNQHGTLKKRAQRLCKKEGKRVNGSKKKLTP